MKHDHKCPQCKRTFGCHRGGDCHYVKACACDSCCMKLAHSDPHADNGGRMRQAYMLSNHV